MRGESCSTICATTSYCSAFCSECSSSHVRSRERIEDECIARIRLNALLGALYATFGLTLITALVLYDFEFLYFMIFNLCLLPVLFLIIEQLLLWRFRQEGRHEE
ncbi:hypothetical protein [uncultured Alistipes sp.]|uniref:hypothetical protein n=1 Tax=uncultured Alistipes sp. TaxID=538949 RepID=UPI002604ACCF|nr:hypothetical protein [uncultured Alistipes sp.]